VIQRVVDADLVRRMALVRDVSSLGRAARAAEKLKVRQPLAKVEVILAAATPADEAWLDSHADLVCDELNVKQFEICREPDRYITRSVLPDLKKLGPGSAGSSRSPRRVGQGRCRHAPGNAGQARHGGGAARWRRLGYDPEDDVIIRTTAKEGWAAAEAAGRGGCGQPTHARAFVAEGLVREVVHAIQSQRKSLDLDFTDRIGAFETDSDSVREAIAGHLDYVAAETLATRATFGTLTGSSSETSRPRWPRPDHPSPHGGLGHARSPPPRRAAFRLRPHARKSACVDRREAAGGGDRLRDLQQARRPRPGDRGSGSRCRHSSYLAAARN